MGYYTQPSRDIIYVMYTNVSESTTVRAFTFEKNREKE